MTGRSSPTNNADKDSRHFISDTKKTAFSQKHRRIAAASAKKQQSATELKPSTSNVQHRTLRDPRRRAKHDSTSAAAIRRALRAISVDMEAESSAIHVGADVDIAGVELDVDLTLGNMSSSSASSSSSSPASSSAASTSSAPPSASSPSLSTSSSPSTSSAPPTSSSAPPSTSSAPPSSTSSAPPSSSSSTPSSSSSPPSSSSASTISIRLRVHVDISVSIRFRLAISVRVRLAVSVRVRLAVCIRFCLAVCVRFLLAVCIRLAGTERLTIRLQFRVLLILICIFPALIVICVRFAFYFRRLIPYSFCSNSLPPSSSFISASSASSLPASTSSTFSSISMSTTPSHNLASGSVTFSTTATSSGASGTHTGSLNSGGGSADSFARNVGGIVGVAIGGVVALVVGVLVVFYLCGRFRPRFRAAATASRGTQGGVAATDMRERGGWTSPLARDDESLRGYGATGTWQGASSQEHASAEGSGEGSSEARASSEVHGLHGSSSGHGHTTMAFAEAGETLAAGAVLGAASSLGHGQAPSSQGHSNSSNSHANTGSSSSHAQMSSPTSSSPPHASSSDHGNTSGSAYTHTRASPPSSYALHQPQPQAPREEGGASPKPSPFLWRLRGGQGSSTPTPPAFDPSTLQPPTARSGRPPSSLLNPPSTWGEAFAQAVSTGSGWRPPPLVSPALSTGSNASDDAGVVPREGLLRPGLAVLQQSHSTRSLWDHVDYSRPIAGAGEGRTNLRMESAATFATMTSGADGEREEGHSQTGEVGEWPAPTPPPG
ncbi:hypothetical protein C8R45DRAFT_1089844 [Mycena sanguinolenta]|nr:hypothetical protein C8R45DRAFT_1089844 [Mycena sanguinolenta]